MEPWWEEENKLMDFDCIDHASGTVNGSSEAYDEMMDYVTLKCMQACGEIQEVVKETILEMFKQ